MTRPLHLVSIQLDITWEDRPANHGRVRKLLQGVDIPPGAIILLPEMFDVGFSMNLERTAQSEARESESFLRQLAREFRVAVLGGVVGTVRAGCASNEAVAFDPEGTELVRYHKLQPFTPPGEHLCYGQGDQFKSFVWQNAKISPYICYDLRFPEIFRPAAISGTEVFLVIASWPAMRAEHWVRLLQARAIENQAFVIGLNRCGHDPSFPYAGRSAAFDPLGNSLFETDNREQVVQTTIDVDDVSRWREQFPALRDIRTSVEIRPTQRS